MRWYTNVLDVVALVLARGGVEGGVRKLQWRIAGVGRLLEDDLKGLAVARPRVLVANCFETCKECRAWKE